MWMECNKPNSAKINCSWACLRNVLSSPFIGVMRRVLMVEALKSTVIAEKGLYVVIDNVNPNYRYVSLQVNLIFRLVCHSIAKRATHASLHV
jgi:hypothetical protein